MAISIAALAMPVLPQNQRKIPETLTAGIMAGDNEQDKQWEIIKENAKKDGLTLKIKTFSDYTQPQRGISSWG